MGQRRVPLLGRGFPLGDDIAQGQVEQTWPPALAEIRAELITAQYKGTNYLRRGKSEMGVRKC